MLKRKIISRLAEWKNETRNKALLIKGARQVGKTTIVRQFLSGGLLVSEHNGKVIAYPHRFITVIETEI